MNIRMWVIRLLLSVPMLVGFWWLIYAFALSTHTAWTVTLCVASAALGFMMYWDSWE